MCPDYRLTAEILQKEKSLTAPFVSESGGSDIRGRNLVYGLEAEEIESSTSGSGSDSESFSEREGGYHPPAGGQKNPKMEKGRYPNGSAAEGGKLSRKMRTLRRQRQ